MSILDQAAGDGLHILGYGIRPGQIVKCTPEQLAAASQDWWNQAYLNKYYYSGMQDINASTETAYPNDSLNKKLEAAKKWLKERK